MKLLLLIMVCVFSASGFGKEPASPPPFLTEQQKADFAKLLISEIERLDAEIIETRNHSKAVSWPQFKQWYEKKFTSTKDWASLRRVFLDFSQGLVNLHTRTKFLVYEPESRERKWLNDEILFTFPERKFYLASNKQQITHFNGVPIETAFYQFDNYRCRHNNPAGCFERFARYIEADAIEVKGQHIESLTTINKENKVSLIKADFSASRKPRQDVFAENYCNSHQSYDDFTLEYAGYNICLYQHQKNALIRIRHFKYKDHDESDIYCAKSKQSTTCKDVNQILAILHKQKPEHLIFDMTQNFGGNENTTILAAFMPAKFKDLPVAYKNTKEMKNSSIRQELFYGNPRGENWYQKVKDVEDEYFVPRADFCRGAEDCSLQWIAPRKDHYQAEKISIITDWMCVSSCDDFVWRMQDYAGGKVYGLTPAQDATYARIKLYLYLDKNGVISKKVVGEMTDFVAEEGEQLLATVRMPYSKTVTEAGKLRNTEPNEVSLVPYTLDNRNHYANAVLQTLLN